MTAVDISTIDSLGKTIISSIINKTISETLSSVREAFAEDLVPSNPIRLAFESENYRKGWCDCRREAIRYIDYTIMHWEDDNQAHEPSRMD